MKSVLSVDWLSYYGEYGQEMPTNGFELQPREYGTKVFNNVSDVYFGNKKVAVLAFNPRSSIIEKTGAVLKFENNILYEKNFPIFRKKIIKGIKFHAKSINRLDLALDFNFLENGMNGHIFIKQFTNDKYLHNGRGKFQIQGVQKFESNYEYLRLGSNTSPVIAYLYNKTQEMADVKDKPYIREKWELNGLNADNPVWRLEFRMNSDFFTMVDKDSGEFPLEYNFDFKEPERLVYLYQSLVNQYFDFRLNNGTKNKSRMPKVEIINLSKVSMKVAKVQAENTSSRREKILLHSLYKFSKRYGINNEIEEKPSNETMYQLIRTCGMQEYFEKKQHLWDSAE